MTDHPDQVDEYGIPIKTKQQPQTDEFGIPIKKKGLGAAAGKVSLNGSGLGASVGRSIASKAKPQTIEQANRDFEDFTGHKEFDLGSDLPQIKKAREQKKFAQNTAINENEIMPVLQDVFSGTIQPEKLKALYNKPYGKKLVGQAIAQAVPQASQLALDDDTVGNEKKWEVIAEEIQRVNRDKGIEVQAEQELQLNNDILSATTNLKYGQQQVQLSGRDEAALKKDLNDFGEINLGNPQELGQVLSKIERAQSLFDKDGNKVEGKEELHKKVRQKLLFIKAQEEIPEEIESLTENIRAAVGNVKSAGWKKNVDPSQVKELEQTDAEYIKAGLNYIRDANPGAYKNIRMTIGAAHTLSDTDYEMLVNTGKELVNQRNFRTGQLVKDDNRDFSTYQTRRAEISGVLSEDIKKMGYKNMAKVPDKVIVSAALKRGIDPDGEEVMGLRQDEAATGGGIVKGGGLTAFMRGVASPIKSIQQTFNQWSPVETYLNSKRFDYGDQKIPDAAGNYSDVLPSERKINSFGNFFNKAVEGTGQLFTQVLIARGIGKGLELPYKAGAMFAPRAALTAKQSSNIAAYGGGFLSTTVQEFGHDYLDFLTKTGDPNKASLMALSSSLGKGIIEVGILPDVKLAETMMGAFKTAKDKLARNIVGVIERGGKEQAIRPFIKTFVNETAKIVGKEAWGEEVLQNAWGYFNEALFSKRTAEKRDLLDESIDVGKEATAQTLLYAIGGGYAKAKTRAEQKFTKDALHTGAINFDQYKEAMDVSLSNGNTSQQDYDKSISILTSHKESIANAPKRDANNDVVSMERQLEYAFQDTISKENQELAAKQKDQVQREPFEKKVKDADDIKRKIFYGEEIKELPKEEIVDDTPEEQIVKLAGEGKLGAMSEHIASNPDTAQEALLDYAKQKYGVDNEGNDYTDGAPTLSKEVDSVVTKAYPTKESLLAELKPKEETVAIDQNRELDLGQGEEVTTPTESKPHSIISETKWYRGVNKNNKEQGDKFFSADESVSGDYAIDKVGDKPQMTEISKDELPSKPLVVGTKEDLAETIGFPEENIYDLDSKFDKAAKKYAQENGYDGIVYESGSFDAPEMHIFEKAKTPPKEASAPSIEEVSGEARQKIQAEEANKQAEKKAELESQRDAEILSVGKPEIKERSLTDKEFAKLKAEDQNKYEEWEKNESAIRKLIDCLWKK